MIFDVFLICSNLPENTFYQSKRKWVSIIHVKQRPMYKMKLHIYKQKIEISFFAWFFFQVSIYIVSISKIKRGKLLKLHKNERKVSIYIKQAIYKLKILEQV